MTELNRAQLQAWESSLQQATGALDYEGAGLARLRGRLRNTVSALRESVESVRRLVTALASARRQLAEEHDRLAGVTDQLPIPYLVTTQDGTILRLNPAASTALNVSARALVGRNLLVFFDDREAWFGLLTQITVSAIPVERAAKLRPRERLQESVMVYVSGARSGEVSVIQWFVTGNAPDTTAPRLRRCAPGLAAARPLASAS